MSKYFKQINKLIVNVTLFISIMSCLFIFAAQGNVLYAWNLNDSPAPSYIIGGYSQNGEFMQPQKIATNSLGNIYVTDTYNHRVQVFDSSGSFLFSFGNYGSGNGQLSEPSGIAIDNQDRVYVTEVSNHRVQVFNKKGDYLFKFGSNGSSNGEFNKPRAINIGISQRIYVADT